jgi:hypothetical protein
MSRVIGAVVVAGVLAFAGEAQVGKGVAVAEATPIKALYEAPDTFVGKTVRVDGVVSAVCEAMGCWMALADPKDPALVVRFKVDHGSGLVFPVSAKGKPASAEGVFEKIAAEDHEAHEAAAEHAKAAPTTSEFAKTYQIRATGALIK